MKILVAGGKGFIGSYVVEKLCNLGHQIHVLDNEETYDLISRNNLQKLYQWRQRNWNKSVSGMVGCVTDRNSVLSAFSTRPDVVIHLASYPRARIVNENPIVGVNNIIGGTINLLDHCRHFDVKRFVFVSSSMIYGDFDDGVKENANTKPTSVYGEAKLASERFCKHFEKYFGLEYVIVRPSGVYGPGDTNDRVVSKFLCQAKNNHDILCHTGVNKVDFTYVEDAADGIIKSALVEEAKNLSFNIGSGQGTELNNIAGEIVSMCGSASNIKHVEKESIYPRRGALDVSRAVDILGYQPRVKLIQGLKKLKEWHDEF